MQRWMLRQCMPQLRIAAIDPNLQLRALGMRRFGADALHAGDAIERTQSLQIIARAVQAIEGDAHICGIAGEDAPYRQVCGAEAALQCGTVKPGRQHQPPFGIVDVTDLLNQLRRLGDDALGFGFGNGVGAADTLDHLCQCLLQCGTVLFGRLVCHRNLRPISLGAAARLRPCRRAAEDNAGHRDTQIGDKAFHMPNYPGNPAKMTAKPFTFQARAPFHYKSCPTMSKQAGLTYRDAGVDIDAGDALVDDIKKIVKSTQRPEVLAGVGGFGALVGLPKKYKEPILVSGTDGVGTKLMLGIETERIEGLGQDLVGMCANDVLVSGAEPLFFLDYYATGKLETAVAAQVVRGIARGCKLSGCALVGGETAEMPGMYPPGDFDLAGFCVGVVEKKKIINGKRIKKGDVLIALPSSGPHSNGYSLVRRILELRKNHNPLAQPIGKGTLLDALMAPTTLYAKPVLGLLASGVDVRGMSHITGGGLPGNIPRCFPDGVGAVIDTQSWKVPEVFNWLQQAGGIETDEMRRVFNCGVGFVIIVPRLQADRALEVLRKAKAKPWILGEMVASDTPEDVRFA